MEAYCKVTVNLSSLVYVLGGVSGDKENKVQLHLLHQMHSCTTTTTPNAKKWLYDKVKGARKCEGYVSVLKRKMDKVE